MAGIGQLTIIPKGSVMKIAYIGLDTHASTCTLGYMNRQGRYVDEWTFPTSESQLIRHVVGIKAKKKYLTLEESSLAFWIARTLREYVEDLTVCNPMENHLISKSARKNDSLDSFRLCRLLRLGELKEVYHPEEDHRAIFKTAVDQYLDLRDQQIALKQKIKAKYRSWGVFKGASIHQSNGAVTSSR